MDLTNKQKLSLQGKTQAQKRNLIARYRQQNATTGNTNTTVARRTTPTFARANWNPTRTITRQATPSSLGAAVTTITGNTILKPLVSSATKGAFNHTSIVLTIENIPALKSYKPLYDEWRYSNLSVSLTSAVADSEPGYSFILITPTASADPSSEDQLFKFNTVAINSVHRSIPPVKAPQQLQSTWYKTHKDKEQPCKVHLGTSGTAEKVTVGIVHIQYTIHFRIPT